MMNKYYKKIIMKNYEVIVRQQRGGIYRMYLVKNGLKTGDFIEFSSRGRASILEQKAITIAEHTNISNALCALSNLIDKKLLGE